MSGEEGFELEREGEILQARQFPRALLRDSRIGFAAKGLFAFLWDLPTGWRVRANHLTSVGPNGRDAIRSILRELEAVAALRVEVVRGERGRVAGKRWVLRSPHLWAAESPLSVPGAQPVGAFTEGRETRLSEKPKIGKAAPKVFTKLKDSSSPPSRSSFEVFHGIACWTPTDRDAAQALVAETPSDELSAAIQLVETAGQEPLPGRVRRILAQRARHRKAKVRQAEEPPKPRTPEAAQAGLKAVKALLAGAEAPCAGHPTP